MHSFKPIRTAILSIFCAWLLVVTAHADVAAIAAPDRPAAAVAEDVLRSGGNAVDAAVAVGFALAVTFPEAGNLGGGGFATLHVAGESSFLDFRETAPAAATRDMYLDAEGKVIPQLSLVGHRASGVPGTVAGLWELHRRYGSRPWAELLAPAIRLAREGFVPDAKLIRFVREAQEDYAGKTNFERYFGGIKENTPFKQPELAATLERIAAQGPTDFYRGKTAQLLAAEMQRGKGLITTADLDAYRPIWRKPLLSQWRDYTLVTPPPPSSGGIALIQYLRMKDLLADQFRDAPHNSTRYVHLVAEISKQVFADRAEYLGDPDFVSVPVERLIDPVYLRRRAAEINPTAPSAPAKVKPGLTESLETTHYSILDGKGNAVSLTYTLNGGFGSGVVVEGAGFLLNNEMDDFSTKPGQPNLYGVVGGTANAIAPGKRMLSSMTPTILLKDARVRGVYGTPGGSTIFPAVFQTIVNIKDFGMTPEQAVAAPRFQHQLLPPNLIVYSRCCVLAETTRNELTAMGYRVEMSPWEFGDMQIIEVDANERPMPASDPRGRGESRVIDLDRPTR
jgi:gamma-glutamyltranspeptidase/glutathione hydrolase